MKFLLYILFLFVLFSNSSYDLSEEYFYAGLLVKDLITTIICLYILGVLYSKVFKVPDIKFTFYILFLIPIVLSSLFSSFTDFEWGALLSPTSSTLISSIILFLALYIYNHNQGDSNNDKNETRTGKDLAIYLLRMRATELKKRASTFLVLIMILLVTAGINIILASFISGVDRDSLSTIENVINQAKDSHEKLEAAQSKLDNFIESPNDPKQKKSIDSLSKDVVRLKKEYDYLRDKESRLLSQYSNEAPVGAFEDKEFLSIFSIRFGVTIIILFFVQVLVNLYRYNVRLASYYDGKADALLLSKSNLSNFEDISKSLSPEDLHFGTPPNTPIEKLMDTIIKIKAGKSDL